MSRCQMDWPALGSRQGELDCYEVKLEMMTSAVAELEMELACKDEQIHCLKAVVAEGPDELPRQLVAAQEERAELRAQLGKLQRQQQLRDQAAAAQVAALRAALANANARLKAAGGAAAPPSGSSGDVGGGAVDQGAQQQQQQHELRSPSLASDGPPTPLSPGQATPTLQKHCTSSWDGIDEPLGPVLCRSPVAVRKGLRVSGARGSGDGGGDDSMEPVEPDSPRSDLSGPIRASEDGAITAGAVDGTVHGDASCRAGGAGGVGERAAFSARLACNNPLFRDSADSRRALASLEGSALLRASSVASLDGRSGFTASSGGAAAFGLAKAQLEIQLHHAQQRLAALQSSAAIGCNQAQAAQARLRVAVRCLESLHALLKAALEQGGGACAVDARQLRTRLSVAVQDLAALAKAQREIGSCLDMLRLLLHRMAGADAEDGGGEAGAPAGGGAATAAAIDALVIA
ncbi:hypothetical protein Rsub_01172 [Raphidocelis subcapitata]|uniref:Uncharacterized protein n=1 Tax=Raphidocelis subcapitata TaxID=307507 RepID=A0A2V0NMS5_9CHLO|nr:hypothetical protein Rsub_01172 [Raphidocelis subcapitata]|eukprot:GBF88459.1 hypothetical protein Rsub_01172 [Raphidocelis subcapitata]